MSAKEKWESILMPRYVQLGKYSNFWAKSDLSTHIRYGNAIIAQNCSHCNSYLPLLEETVERLEKLAINDVIDVADAATNKCIKDSILKLVELNVHLQEKHGFINASKYHIIGILIGLIGLSYCFIYKEFLFGIICFIASFLIGRHLDMRNVIRGKSI